MKTKMLIEVVLDLGDEESDPDSNLPAMDALEEGLDEAVRQKRGVEDWRYIEQPGTEVEHIARALELLKQARNHLIVAGAPKSTARVRLVISSVKGALGNARHRAAHAQRGETRTRIKRAPKMRVQTYGK